MRLIMKMILLHRAQPEAKPQGRRLAYDGWQEAAPFLLTAHQRDILQAEDPAVCGRPYVTQTHFAVGGEMYLPAFQIVPDVDEDAAGMTVAAAVPGAAPRPLMELAPGNGLYADVPTGKYKKDKQGDKTRWQFQYDRAVERTALGSVHPGETDIYLYDADGTMHGPVRRLVVLPSSMTATALHRMVQEILSLCRDLVALDPARRAQAKAALTFDVSGASGMPRTPDAPDASDAADGAAAFQQLLGRTAQALAVLAPALARIDRRPRFRLQQERRRVPARRLKAIRPRILQQHLANPARAAYDVMDARRTLDIYEHRLLKSRIAALKSCLTERRASLAADRAVERRAVLAAMQREAGFAGAAGIDEADGTVHVSAGRSREEAAILTAWTRHAARLRDDCAGTAHPSDALALQQLAAEALTRRWQAAEAPLDDTLYGHIQSQLAALLALPVLQAAAVRDEPWRMTQVFTNDPRYRTAIRALRELDDAYAFTTGAGSGSLVHEKVDKLYEYWMFCRILKTLVVRQRWQIADHATVVAAIRALLLGDGAPPQRVTLTHPVRRASAGQPGATPDDTLRMEIFYDTPLGLSLADALAVLDAEARGRIERLRPDFLFRVRSANGKTDDAFVLDAKYRNYADMGASYWRDEDISGVCADKYLARPRAAGLDIIRAAFIAHTDAAPATPAQPNAGLGAYVTYNAALDPRCDGSGADPLRPAGAFFLVPGADASDQNLEAFFALAFEYGLGAWDTCWHCGSTDVDVRVLDTESGIAKYHMTCRHCHAFWVKTHCGRSRSHTLIKHLFNYFIEDGHKTWFVRCPACAAEAEQKGE